MSEDSKHFRLSNDAPVPACDNYPSWHLTRGLNYEARSRQQATLSFVAMTVCGAGKAISHLQRYAESISGQHSSLDADLPAPLFPMYTVPVPALLDMTETRWQLDICSSLLTSCRQLLLNIVRITIALSFGTLAASEDKEVRKGGRVSNKVKKRTTK